MADPNSDESNRPLSFVACVSDEAVLHANLLTSACLKPGSVHEVILIKNCRSAADGLNLGLARARHELVVCVHQDVRLPPGWDQRLIQQLDAAKRQWGPIGVAGVYGVGDPTEVQPEVPASADARDAQGQPQHQPPKFAVQRVGRVIHRGHPLFDSPNLPAKVSTLDELLLVIPKNTPLRFDPGLGFHFYGADICLQAQEHGLATVALNATCHHNTRTAALPREFFQSARIFTEKWNHRLPVATSCVVIENGNTTDYAYLTSGAAAGALQTITDPVGLVTTLTYNPTTGKLATMTDPANHATTFAFSGNNLQSITDPTGAVTSYGYNAHAQMTTETNPDNQTATVSYDSFGRMSSEKVFGGTGTFSTTAAEEVGLAAAGGTTTLVYSSQFAGSVTDANNATTSLTFDGMGGVISETDGRNNTTTITRNSHDLPIAVTDPLTRTTTYAYDLDENVTTITQADGATEKILYNDSFGIPTHIVDFNGNVTTITLDAHGNITQRTDPDGQSENYTYNTAGQMLTDTDPLGKTTTYAYNGLGQLSTVTEPGTSIATIQYGYDSSGNVKTATDEVGDTITYTYDAMNRVTSSQDPVQAAASKSTLFGYDAAGNLTTETDALGHTITMTYNARNELVSVKDSLSNITTYGYDAEGNMTTVEDPRGKTATYAYDADNDLVSITDPLTNDTTYLYDADNEVTTIISPNSGVTTITYNNLGEESTVILPGQTAPTTYTYDEDGNELSETDQLGDKTVYTYNNMGWEATQTVYPNGSTAETTTYAYDYDGDLTNVTDGLSHTTSYAYDAMGDLISETDPTGGGTTTYGYDLAGRLTSLTDPDSNTTTWTYTHADEVATEVSPLGHATTYTYDLVGNVTSVIDPNSHQITYSYNGDNEETGETWVNPSMGSPLNLVTITYDADGDVTKLQDANTNYQYTYNADDEVSTFADSGTTGLPLVTLTYGYDGDSNETGVSDSLGGLLTLAYDARDELTNEQFSGSGLSAEAVTYGYDAAGRLTGMTRYSNLAETTKVAATAYSYDHADRMTGIVDSNSTGATLVTYGCTYDAADRVSQEVRTWNSGSNADTLTYSYTNNNQLTGVSHSNGSFSNESFTWDSNGNETGSGYTTGTDNEQTASPGYTYTYDNAGEMTSETQTSTGDVWTYGYDFRGRMVTAVEKTSGGTTLESVTYTFDALDNRIGTDENSTQTWTLYDQGNPVMDFNSSGSLTMRYLWGPMGIVARQTSGGTVSWYLADHLGTVRDLMNNSGAIIDHVDFSAFGTVLDESSPTSGDRLTGFAGLERDTVTGLNLAVYREENPGTGRWNSQDPLGFAAGDANLARYVENDASSSSDPSGLQPQKKKRTQSDNDYRPTERIPGDYPTGSELWDPKLFPKIARDMEDIRKLSKDGAERGFVVFRNPKTGRYRNVRAPRGTRNRIDFNKVRRPFGDWEVVCVVHSHPAGGQPDPGRSPLDPGNSNSNILGDPPAPWLVVGPDGTVYLIGPDQVGGKPNRRSRMRPK